MGQVLHSSATTTEAVRRAIQQSQEGVRALAQRHGISPTTVQKWRRRQTTADAAMGPKLAHSPVLSFEQEAMVVAFRRHTLLPLDDCLYALQPTIPALTRSSLHRCLQRHGISRLPDPEGGQAARKRFKAYPIGFVHIDVESSGSPGIAEVRTEQGKLHLFVAVDRTSKFAFAQLHEKATRRVAADFLRALAEALPYKLHTVLTDNGVPAKPRSPRKSPFGDFASLRAFTNNLPDRTDPETEAAIDAIWAARGEPRMYRIPAFDGACAQLGVEHRLTKPYHPWTHGQVERMNRTLKEATVRRYHYASHDELRAHLQLFLDAYNHARRLKALRGLTPYEFICRVWTKEPERFRLDPSHHTPGLNI